MSTHKDLGLDIHAALELNWVIACFTKSDLGTQRIIYEALHQESESVWYASAAIMLVEMLKRASLEELTAFMNAQLGAHMAGYAVDFSFNDGYKSRAEFFANYFAANLALSAGTYVLILPIEVSH